MYLITDYNGNVPSIPVQTISSNTALLLMSVYHHGIDAPADWRGGLNVTYRIGPVNSSAGQYIAALQLPWKFDLQMIKIIKYY